MKSGYLWRALFIFTLAAFTFGLPQTVFAGIIVDPYSQGATDVVPIDPATWTPATDGYIGYYYNGTLLVDADSDLFSYCGTIGYDNSGVYGLMVVDGVGSTWQNTYNLYVGQRGNGTLNITHGGVVSDYDGCIGVEMMSIGNVSVSGIGSAWNHSSNLYVAQAGDGYLNITNGAAVHTSYDSIIGEVHGSNGIVTIDRLGSTWTSGGTLTVGKEGSGLLEIKNGASVSSNDGRIGWAPSGQISVVNVDGVLSTWNSGNSLHVGEYGSGILRIMHGASVNDNVGVIGYVGGSVGTVTVDGALSAWVNRDGLIVGNEGQATLNITNHGLVRTGGLSIGSGSTLNLDGGTLELTNSMNFYNWSGGSFNFTSGEIKVSNGTVTTLNSTLLGDNQTLTVTGSNSHWESGNNTVLVGMNNSPYPFSGHAAMDITGGATAHCFIGIIGGGSGGVGGVGTVTVNGVGSTWSVEEAFYVGGMGSGTLNVTGGGVVNSRVSYIGEQSGSRGTVTIDGSGSRWTTTTDLYVGSQGMGTLNITGGAVTSNTLGTIGMMAGSTGSVTVDGAGSAWANSGTLTVGQNGSGSFAITGGASLSNRVSTTLGVAAGSTGSVTVDGVGSTWVNSGSGTAVNGTLTVGQSGSGSLAITNGASVRNGGCLLGAELDSIGNVTVDGVGSVWTNSGDLYVGKLGRGTLTITNGAVVDSKLSFIGNAPNATGTVTVEGNGSAWNGNGNFVVGNGTLNILNGGLVANSNAGAAYDTIVGPASGVTSTVTVEGDGSTWINSGNLYVGQNNSTCTLKILDGGTVNSGLYHNTPVSYIGLGATVMVDGIGSSWTNKGNLAVGYTLAGTMRITDGAVVSSASGLVGYESGSVGSVLIDGAGSVWNNAGSFVVGWGKSRGTLNITNGGVLNSGVPSAPPDNGINNGSIVTVNGTGSAWFNNNAFLNITNNGVLNITNDGLVRTGSFSLAQGGTLNLDGGTLELTGNMNFYNSSGIFNFNSGEIKVSSGNVTFQMAPGLTSMTLNADQVLTVTGATSCWAHQMPLYINSGSLSIRDSGMVRSLVLDSYIGHASGSNGTVTVEEVGSTWDSSRLTIGHEGNGVLNITRGGIVNTDGGILAYAPGSTGTVTVEGANSQWYNNSGLAVGFDGSGTLNIFDEALVSVYGTLTIDADLSGDSFINMTSGGMLALYGDAEESLDAFLGLVQGTDAIRYWDENLADWASITDATYGEDYTLSYEGDYTVLTVQGFYEPEPPYIPGDANKDGYVDGSDATILAGYWQQSGATWEMGDFNGDGVVDGSDATILAGYWQQGTPPGNLDAVPEPSTILLLLSALVGWLVFKRNC